MAKIHELSVNLANQIAAGEVIERPASVVKELLENALDAHATQIDILIEAAGTKLIEIIDNGDGIDDEDVEVAFRRHATSKINDRQDLFKIRTLGFRGEALPSIASIADVELTTSTGQQAGTAMHIKGGEVLAKTAASARKGTRIKVTELFFNTPARLKYLKSQQTELAKIVDIVNRLALSYPAVTFHLVHNDKQILRTAGNGDVKRVIAEIYGPTTAQKMVPITTTDNDFEVTGFVSVPALTRASRDYISVLINGRYIKNFQITKAIIKGYGSKLMVGRYPFAVINIQMDPLLVDVNVHPTKQEVRLSQEDSLVTLITQAIQHVFTQMSLIPDGYQNLTSTAEQPLKEADSVSTSSPLMGLDFINQLNQTSMKYQLEDRSVVVTEELPTVSAPTIEDDDIPKAPPVVVPKAPVMPINVLTKADLTTPAVQTFQAKYAEEAVDHFIEVPVTMPSKNEQTTLSVAPINDEPVVEMSANPWPELRYMGQMFGTFLFAEGPQGLYLIDQHAAQERINYEYYREEIGHVGTAKQQLLIPLVLDYPLVDAVKITDKLAILQTVGLDLEPFGDNSFILHHHPTWFVPEQVEATTREMIDWVLREGQITTAEFREKTAIMMSCKRAIKANQHLSELEAKELIKHLGMTKNPYNCPHGRPVLVTLSLTDMEKMFKRIQDAHGSWIDYDGHPY
ncbi:DNA mismatch repair endonuclease MutL [Periweissella ghanensis]|uniref:DNA mismatch repair protein MutL n=1 Tax=Periweissella ghanensis TaxID=467997 RepID=A0ABM8ZB08_9LACO|nr:DNA mismatch repair endonuclease MutL [Periweissella ghanensis]MCM0600719.1 DNA mismatch repair endonuclease MutL [Periweissella ghanensis]CAH0418534.1 DNA mismatch repair protein MutL [Periweissella ghanensis]